jgi:hypothetical protein
MTLEELQYKAEQYHKGFKALAWRLSQLYTEKEHISDMIALFEVEIERIQTEEKNIDLIIQKQTENGEK